MGDLLHAILLKHVRLEFEGMRSQVQRSLLNEKILTEVAIGTNIITIFLRDARQDLS